MATTYTTLYSTTLYNQGVGETYAAVHDDAAAYWMQNLIVAAGQRYQAGPPVIYMIWRGLLIFDLSSIPSSAVVTSATLRLYGKTDASTEDLMKLELLDSASEILLHPDLRDEFAAFVRQINRIFKAILPDQNAYQYIKQRVALSVIYRQMRLKSGLDVDDQDVLDVVRTQVNELIEEAIELLLDKYEKQPKE